MDQPFNVTRWQATKPPEPGDLEIDDSVITMLIHDLSEQTNDIVQHPYDPNNWVKRANTLFTLRYPELSLGDAHKATLLCRAHFSRLDHHGWRLGCGMSFWMYDEAPADLTKLEELKERLAIYQSRAHEAVVKCMYYFPTSEEGRFRRRPYPWMNDLHSVRSDELLEQANQEFADNSANGQHSEPYCIVKRHAFGKTTDDRHTSDVLGVFAGRDIQKGQIILVDTSRTWGCNGPGTDGDGLGLRGEGCRRLMHPNSKSDVVELDMRWIRDRAGTSASSVIVGCKLFLCCIQDNVTHPLNHPLIARLTPNYRSDKVGRFSLENDIAVPNEALQQFGIDIFANHNFDTWVLFTLEARALNNSCADPMATSLNPLFSLFNRSCEPNLEWTVSNNHATVRVKAHRYISSGDQLFVDYDSFMREKPLEDRRARLRMWLNGPCQCIRCMREEQDLKKAAEDGLVNGREVPQWDDVERPVFPEDALTLKN